MVVATPVVPAYQYVRECTWTRDTPTARAHIHTYIYIYSVHPLSTHRLASTSHPRRGGRYDCGAHQTPACPYRNMGQANEKMPSSEEALPGRTEALNVSDFHYVRSANRVKEPFPDGFESCVFGTGCFVSRDRALGANKLCHRFADLALL